MEEKYGGALPFNQTLDWHQGIEATGGGVKISFYAPNCLMTFFSHRKLEQNNYAATMASAARRQIIGGGGATINKSRRPRRPQIVGGGGGCGSGQRGRRTVLIT